VALFAPQHDFDRSDTALQRQVAGPLVNGESDTIKAARIATKIPDETVRSTAATKSALTKILQGDIEGATPSLL